jgi:acyl carrier protein
MTDTHLLHKIRTLLSESFATQRQDIDASTKLVSLGMDSLDHVEFIMALEEEFGVDITDEDSDPWKTEEATVQHIMDYLDAKGVDA